MSILELNKIAASIILASLITMIVGTVSNILYRPKLDLTQRGYNIKIVEDNPISPQPSTSQKLLNIEELMSKANAEAGARIIKKCISCHSFNQGGEHKVGPNLWAIINANKGQKSGYQYSKAMLLAKGIWDHESLFHFLQKPSQYIPGTKMSFAGLSKPQEIVDIIAYLKEKK